MPNNQRLSHLDALRGVAAVMVATAHFIERTPLHQTLFFKYINLGQVGVMAFFILSGMVIPYSLKPGNRPILNFWISRFFRLYPAYWFSILLNVVTIVYLKNSQVDMKTIALNITMFQSLFNSPNLGGVYWTLIIEMFFYISCSFLFFINILEKVKVRFAISILMISTALFFSLVRLLTEKKVPVGVPLLMSFMFFGSVWMDMCKGVFYSMSRKLSLILLVVLFSLVVPICFMSYNKDFGHGENAISYIISYGIGIVITMFMTKKVKITNKLVVYLGTVSYSVYLVHQFVLELISTSIDISFEFNYIVFFIYLSCIVALSSLSYFFIEKPCVILGHKVKQRFCVERSTM